MADELLTFAIEAEAMAQVLDSMDYFEVLKIPRTASPAEIKAAYYRESRVYHPDRVFHLPDIALKETVHKVYKRITEAYFVLRDDAKRRKYVVDVSGPDREKKLRFAEQSEQEQKKAKEEEIGTTPNGRKFYGVGLVDFQAGRFEAAERVFKMALMYEPQNQRFKEKLEEASSRVKAKTAQGDGKV